jgi:hypothetical protein
MKAVELARSPDDCCCKIPITLKTPSRRGEQTAQICANAWFQQLSLMGNALLPAAGCTIIPYAVDKQLNKDSRDQATDKSYPQPEHISPCPSKPKYKNA